MLMAMSRLFALRLFSMLHDMLQMYMCLYIMYFYAIFSELNSLHDHLEVLDRDYQKASKVNVQTI